jgi:hypothetical protein
VTEGPVTVLELLTAASILHETLDRIPSQGLNVTALEEVPELISSLAVLHLHFYQLMVSLVEGLQRKRPDLIQGLLGGHPGHADPDNGHRQAGIGPVFDLDRYRRRPGGGDDPTGWYH